MKQSNLQPFSEYFKILPWQINSNIKDVIKKGWITAGDDLNNYIDEGRYAVVHGDISNAPTELATVYGYGILCVFAGGNYVLQILVCTDKIWYRMRPVENWWRWRQI